MNIFVIDDEQVRHDAFEEHLTKAGHTVLHAFGTEEALEVIKSCVETIDLLLTDHDMPPGKNGSFLATEILHLPKEKYPALVFVHSVNHDGALNIISKYQSAGIYTEYRPYSLKMIEKLVKDLEPQ